MANFGKFWALGLFIFDNKRCLSDQGFSKIRYFSVLCLPKYFLNHITILSYVYEGNGKIKQNKIIHFEIFNRLLKANM